ncbi:MAG: O-antigen ligase C-terminal domain-containing protein [Nitrospirae bacterium]|nr:O-antigen ligase C-terminal domain-containing protein [Nitrospirota bacterium]
MNKDTFKNLCLVVLYLLFLAIIHINIRNLGGSVVNPVAYMVWMAVSAVVLLALMQAFLQDVGILVIPKITAYILLFAALFLLPAIFNPITDAHSFIFKNLGLAGGIIFFISLHQFNFSDEQKEKLLYVIFLSAVIEAGIGLAQYLAPWARIPMLAFSTTGDVFGNFQHQNVLASFLATSIVISLYALTAPLFRRADRWGKAGFFIAVTVISFILFITGSRAGLIGLFLGCVTLLITRYRLFKTAPLYLLIWTLAVTAGLGLNLSSEKYLYQKERGVFSAAKKLQTASESFMAEKAGDPRILMYRVSLEMIKDSPVFGHGPGGFKSKYVFFRRQFTENMSSRPSLNTFTYYPHSETLFILIESGLAGGLGLIIISAAFLMYIFRLGMERGGLYASLLLPLTFHSQVEFPFYQSAVHWALFLFLCYLVSSHFVREVNFKIERRLRIALLTASVCVFMLTNIFMARTLSANIKLTEYYRLLTSEGVSRMKLAEPALNNLYLGQSAQRMLMDFGLGMALGKDDKKFLNEFVQWAEEERTRFPHFMLYEGEARALSALEKKDEAFKLLDEGLSLYPDNETLLNAKKELELTSGL